MSHPTHRRRRRGPIAAVLAAATLLSLPLVGQAAHWPQSGGDPGHSGNQPINSAEMPTSAPDTIFSPVTDSGELRTSLVTTGADSDGAQFVAYGMFVNGSQDDDDGRIHLRSLVDGAEKIPANQQNVSDDDGAEDDDVLGTGAYPITPVDTSVEDALGQLYVIHNDDDSDAAAANGCQVSPSSGSENDIAIAQFDEGSGEQVADVAIGQAQGRSLPGGTSDPSCPLRTQISNGYTVESAPVITPPLDSDGTRYLYFLAAKDGGGTPRLFSVKIAHAGTPDADIQATSAKGRDVPNANTKASPTLAYFEDPSRTGVILYVAVPRKAVASEPVIKTYQYNAIEQAVQDGPTSDPAITFAGTPQTISVPVTGDGEMPGHVGSGVEKAPALYVAFGNDNSTPANAADDTTIVRKFAQDGNSNVLDQSDTTSPTAVEGFPSQSLALSALAVAGDAEETGRVVVTTGLNVIALNSETLTPVARYRDGGESLLTPGQNGFLRTSAVTSGGFVFAASDDGAQTVFDLGDLERDTGDFVENQANNLSSFALGQPAYSNGLLQFISDQGLFVYATGVVPTTNDPPIAEFTITPNPAQPNQEVTFDGSNSQDTDGSITQYEWDLDGDGSFETNTGQTPTAKMTYANAGAYSVKLRVTDDGADTSTVAQTLTVGTSGTANKPPTAAFTMTPNPGKTGQTINFDAAGSSDPDGTVASFQWDFDGNGTFETNTGTSPKASRVYPTAGVYNVKLRVTDSSGAATDTVRQLTITGTSADACGATRCPASLTARVSPRRDASAPFRFTTSGRLSFTSKVATTDGCKGRVRITVKRGKKTLSSKRVAVRANCTYRGVSSIRSGVGTAKTLRVIARFLGNEVLAAKSARGVTVRVK